MQIDAANVNRAFARETRPVTLTLEEAWLLDSSIRHTWTDEERPIGKGLLLKVFSLIMELKDKPTAAAIAIELTEDECWTVDYHIRRAQKDDKGFTIGQPILLKVFPALLSFGTPDLPTAEGAEPANWRSKLADFKSDANASASDQTEGAQP